MTTAGKPSLALAEAASEQPQQQQAATQHDFRLELLINVVHNNAVKRSLAAASSTNKTTSAPEVPSKKASREDRKAAKAARRKKKRKKKRKDKDKKKKKKGKATKVSLFGSCHHLVSTSGGDEDLLAAEAIRAATASTTKETTEGKSNGESEKSSYLPRSPKDLGVCVNAVAANESCSSPDTGKEVKKSRAASSSRKKRQASSTDKSPSDALESPEKKKPKTSKAGKSSPSEGDVKKSSVREIGAPTSDLEVLTELINSRKTFLSESSRTDFVQRIWREDDRFAELCQQSENANINVDCLELWEFAKLVKEWLEKAHNTVKSAPAAASSTKSANDDDDEPYPLRVTDFPSIFRYDYDPKCRKAEVEVDDKSLAVDYNYLTTNTKSSKPKAQLTAESLKDSRAPLITFYTHGRYVKVKFSSGACVHVLYARKNSTCPRLRKLYNSCYSDRGMAMEDALNQMSWEYDHSAGGRYVALGIGSMDMRNECKPFYLKKHGMKESVTITEALSDIFGVVGECVSKYVPEAFKQNESLKRGNEKFSFPPLSLQGMRGWFVHQVAIRRVGSGFKSKSRSNHERNGVNVNVVGVHTDRGDLDTLQAATYLPRGGKDNRGGFVADSQLVVCENETGGEFVRIETNIEDTVCVVLFNSAVNLHGLVEGDKTKETNAWSTRLIPFITKKVNDYMVKNPGDKPNDKFGVSRL